MMHYGELPRFGISNKEVININKNRFYKIVQENKIREQEIVFRGEVFSFYEEIDLPYGNQISDVIQAASLLMKKKEFKMIELPLKDQEISAFYFNGDKKKSILY